ncbi:MAG: cyclic nucleotide-binding domain-containing protein [Spirochaetota bacterium]
MEKINITQGVYWVDIPEANLYVLCGCPADSVKHMMKRGLIVNKEKQGVVYETGPNAILLSDLSIQNGSFANLAEFPVLQMLYRQGMILPGHPNNTGIKPMLIGQENQVRAQSQYIYRGIYGLISEEEITAAGVPRDEAGELMRLKLRFAFNRIKNTEELIEFRTVDNGAVELRNGVYIARKGFNIYQFSCGEESVVVNLNLANDESYRPTYSLGVHRIKKEYFSVIHIGEGDGWDVDRPCMGSILSFQGKLYLIDAGPNIIHSLTSLGISVNEIEGIFHTHAHDDHFAGLPSLLRSDHLIKYFTTPMVRDSVVKKLAALMAMNEDSFNKYFEIHDLEVDTWNNIEGLEVMPVYSPHPVETNIMFFRTLWEGGNKTYAHFADIVSFDVLQKMITDDPSESGITEEFYHRVRKNYLRKVDLKKIDIGGGLIHGRAEDFIKDQSSKIILSHTSLELTDSQKEIGSNATFGMEDVLIPAVQDYSMQSAFNYLRSYLPSVPLYEIYMLLNCQVVTFNAGSILIKKGTENNKIYLILNGVVEIIRSETGTRNMLSAGSPIGELSSLIGGVSDATFRAASYIRVLKIPCNLYLEVIKRNDLYEDIRKVHENRQFLQSTWLFGEMVSSLIQNRIVHYMSSITCSGGECINSNGSPWLYLLDKGDIEIYSGKKLIEKLTPGDFFGEEAILMEKPTLFTAHVKKRSRVYLIPGEVLEDIPIVQLKLLETFKKRLGALGSRYPI